MAILAGDWHLSLKPPVARSAEPNWLEAQKRVLDEVEALAITNHSPIIVAGDLFDKWNPSPELINWCLKHLPDGIYAIPGNHDLPCHRLEDIHKSGFWTLVEAGKIKYIDSNTPYYLDQMVLYGFPCGIEPTKFSTRWYKDGITVHLAVVHEYCWKPGYSYPGAPDSNSVQFLRKRLRGFDAVVVGDNHLGFLSGKKKPPILNAGSLMRRKADEVNYRPSVGLLHLDCSITRHYLNCEQDQWIDLDKVETTKVLELEEFLEELGNLDTSVLNVREALSRYFHSNKVTKGVKKELLEAVEQKGK